MSLGLESLRVLLIDDNWHMRSIAMTLLHGFGITQIREFSSGQEGVAAAKVWPADLAIVDFKMAPMNGVEFTRTIRTAQDSLNPYLPVIMMTGHSARVRVMEARDAGVNEFIAKPLTAKTLLNRLNAVIYHQRPFIRTSTYFGPDRRRRADPAHTGPWRRFDDAQAQTLRAAAERVPPGEDDLVWSK